VSSGSSSARSATSASSLRAKSWIPHLGPLQVSTGSSFLERVNLAALLHRGHRQRPIDSAATA
jgi:hypothetical protein